MWIQSPDKTPPPTHTHKSKGTNCGGLAEKPGKSREEVSTLAVELEILWSQREILKRKLLDHCGM